MTHKLANTDLQGMPCRRSTSTYWLADLTWKWHVLSLKCIWNVRPAVVFLTSSSVVLLLLLWHKHVYLAHAGPGKMPTTKVFEMWTAKSGLEFWSSDTFWSSDAGQTDRQEAMHLSPPCISTGVLKNCSFQPSNRKGDPRSRGSRS